MTLQAETSGAAEADTPPPTSAPGNQEIYERASAQQQDRYLELMRHDPIAGMAYLEVLAQIQQGQGGGE